MHNFYLTDLDKTFLHSDLSVSSYSRRIWNGAVKEGKKLSIATARSYTGINTLLSGLELREPLILLDGVMIASPEGEMIHTSALNQSMGDEIVSHTFKKTGLYPLIVGLNDDGTESFIYPKKCNRCQEELLKTFHNKRRVVSSDPFRAMKRNLKIVYMESEAVTAEIESELRSLFGDAIEIKRSADPYIECWFLTVLHPRGDKAHALQILEEIEGADRKHTTVFGDSHNDLGLFTAAGRKIAVSNAIDELKEQADIVLPWSNDQDAVARFLAEEFGME